MEHVFKKIQSSGAAILSDVSGNDVSISEEGEAFVRSIQSETSTLGAATSTILSITSLSSNTVPMTNNDKTLVSSGITKSLTDLYFDHNSLNNINEITTIGHVKIQPGSSQQSSLIINNNQVNSNAALIEHYKSRNGSSLEQYDYIGANRYFGKGTSSYNVAGGVYCHAAENFTNSSSPGTLELATTPVGGIYDITHLKVTSSGEVAIGEDVTPAAKLHIKQTDSLPALLIENSGTGDCLQVMDSASPDLTITKIDSGGRIHTADYINFTQNYRGPRMVGLPSSTLLVLDYDVLEHSGNCNLQHRFFRSSNSGSEEASIIISCADGTSNRNHKLSANGGSTSLCQEYGGVVIGGSTCNSSAILDLQSTSKTFLPPRMTSSEKNAIGTASIGSVIYDTTSNKLSTFNGSAWSDCYTGVSKYESIATVPDTSGTVVHTWSHGMGLLPDIWSVNLVCIVAIYGYAVGDQIIIAGTMDGDGARNFSCYCNTTEIGLIGESFSRISITQISNPVDIFAPSSTNWRIIAKAIKF